MNNKPTAIIGAGIAGCATARLLAQYGHKVVVFEQAAEVATAGSGNPAAMVYPRLSGNNLASQFALAAFEYCLAFYQSIDLAEGIFQQCGLLELGFDEKAKSRIQKAASIFPGYTKLVDAVQASQLAGIVCETSALYLKQAGWLKPNLVCQQLLNHSNITLNCETEITSLSAMQDFAHVVLSNAHQAATFEQTSHLRLNPVLGQVSLLTPTPNSSKLKAILCSDGYLSPKIDEQHSLGATFETDFSDLSISSEAHQKNLNKLVQLPTVLQDLNASDWRARTGLRCVTNDRLPMVGGVLDTSQLGKPLPRAGLKDNTLPWRPHLWVNVAHGSHGFINAPYSAHLLVQLITKQATPPELDHLAYLNPNRFYLRELGLKQLARTVASADMSQLHFAPV